MALAQASLRVNALTAAGLQLAISGISLVAIVIARDGGAAPSTIEVLFSAIGVGGVIGTALAPMIRCRLGVGGAILVVMWLHAALWMLLAFTPNLVVVGIAVALQDAWLQDAWLKDACLQDARLQDAWLQDPAC